MLTQRIRNQRNQIRSDKDSEKSEILGDFFSSVFTKEPEGDTPTLERESKHVRIENN